MSTIGRLVPTLFLLLALLHVPACDQARAEEVRAAYESIVQTANDCDGAKFVTLLTDASITQYDRAMDLARTGKRDEVKTRQACDRAMVVRMRHRLTASELRNLDGRGCLVLATDRGWNVHYSDAVQLGTIKFRGSSASAEIEVNDRPTGYYYDFDLIDDTWKLDWTRVDAFTNHYIAEAAESARTTEDTIILRLESERTGEKVPQSIWDPR